MKLCVGLIMGMCGHITYIPYNSEAECIKQQAMFNGRENVTYAICFPGVVK
jgi:hypothetical protein